MKNNDDRILKYLSELMDMSEQAEFEKDLSNSSALRNELESVKNQINKAVIPESIKTDERYFINLLPRVHQRMEKRNKLFTWKTAYYAVPTATAILVFTLLMFNSKTDFESGYKDLAKEVVNNFSDQEVSQKYFTEIDSSPADAIVPQGNNDLSINIPADLYLSSESYTKLIDNPFTDDYSTLSRLSDQELEIIYEKLSSVTSKKVTK